MLLLALALTLVGLVRVVGGESSELPRATVVADETGCADVLFLGVDGRGESPVSGGVFGPTLNVLHGRYTTRVTPSLWSLETVRIPFTSRDLSVLKTPRRGATDEVVTARSAKRWARGISGATDRAVEQLRAAARACPQQQLVLAGYSQGAAVVHRTLVGVRRNPAITARITAAVLVGDPDRVRDTTAMIGGMPKAPRSARGVLNVLTAPVADVPQRGVVYPVWSLCNKGDVVCDFGPTRLRDALRAHNSYRSTTAGSLRGTADKLYVRTTKHPKPSVSPLNLELEVSKPVRQLIGVDVAAASRPDVRFTTRAKLPPGLLLSESGLLSGVPVTPGTWTVLYTVRNTESPEFSRKVPGVLVLVVSPSGTGTISTGGGQTCSVREDGTAWCWGRNNWGQLGTGDTTYSNEPVQAGTYDKWTTITTSGTSTCAIRQNRTLWCWGLNHDGQLGDGTTTTRKRPVRVGDDYDWAMVSNSWFHTCAVKVTGTLWCWGFNDRGQLGDGTLRRRLAPKQVAGSDFATVTAGGTHTCATRTNGTLWCWGANDFGQLGDRSKERRLTPVRVGDRSDWTTVNASWTHTCGTSAAGAGRCWGRNTVGQLGDGTRQNRNRPTLVAGGPWVFLRAGDAATCGVVSGGVLWCWGANSYGQLGTGSKASALTPVRVPGLSVVSVDTAWVHTCAVRTDGSPVCWGRNENGQLGDGTYFDSVLPVPVA